MYIQCHFILNRRITLFNIIDTKNKIFTIKQIFFVNFTKNLENPTIKFDANYMHVKPEKVS